jgi:hypothetical protein
MSGTNSFLKEFLTLRKSLSPSDIAASAAVGALGSAPPVRAAPRTRMNKKKDAGPEKKEHDTTLASIVEKKPGIKDMYRYFQQRANDLTIAKMAS